MYYLLLRDLDTQDVLKIEARMSKIYKLEILTKFRTIEVGDTQMLQVQGFDQQGNTFSSLEGVRFDWKIEQAGKNAEFVSIKVSFSSYILRR